MTVGPDTIDATFGVSCLVWLDRLDDAIRRELARHLPLLLTPLAAHVGFGHDCPPTAERLDRNNDRWDGDAEALPDHEGIDSAESRFDELFASALGGIGSGLTLTRFVGIAERRRQIHEHRSRRDRGRSIQ